MKLNDESFRVVQKFCYSSNTNGGRVGVVESILVRIKKGWVGLWMCYHV